MRNTKMKIIKEGKKLINTMQVTCKKCEAVLEIEAKDLVGNSQDDEIYTYKCPCCQRTQYIQTKNMSEEVVFDLLHR